MKITKDTKIISAIYVQKGTTHIIKFDVGPALGEIEGDITYEGMISAIEKGQKFQVQAYDSGDPANVVVKETKDGGKVLTTGKDSNKLNNLTGSTSLKVIEVGKDVNASEESEEEGEEEETKVKDN